jgi:hypothetical protein
MAQEIALQIENPDWSGAAQAVLQLDVTGASPPSAATSHTLPAGAYSTVRIRVPASAVAQTLRLEALTDFPLPAPDTRRRSARLLSLSINPAPVP